MSREGSDRPASGPASSHTVLEQYGIVRYATDHFVVGGYRYSRLEDAVAEAKRRLDPPGHGS